jgi:CheY-like chemotaxis protein
MVYGFVKQTGGHVKIYSEVGHGTTLKIYLPRAFQAETAPTEVLEGPVEGGNETILVVEDDVEVRTTAVEMLSELGYRVLKAGDAQGALAIIQSGVPVDLLFTDVVMPGPIRSPELARLARQALPELEVLFTSGYTENAIVHGGRLDPGVALLVKPYRREDLARKIRMMLRNRQQRQSARDMLALRRERVRASRAPAEPPKKTRLRVLLVEDDDDIRTSAYELLGMLGHDVLAVSSAEEARAALSVNSFDVLFTDVSLPGMSGVELAREAVRRIPGLRVIVASGYGSATEGLEKGLSAVVLPKPYALPQIERALEQVGEGR